MKAIVARKHGDLNDVEVASVSTPEPGVGEALVKVEAAALNPLDFWILRGWRGLRRHRAGGDIRPRHIC